MLKVILLLILSVLAGVLYRLGGAGVTGSWYDGFANTKARDFGVPMCGIIALCFSSHILSFSWGLVGILFLTFGLMFASLISYYKKKGQDAVWWNWALVGFFAGLALLPFAWFTGLWWPMILRTGLLTLLITVWSLWMDNVVWEECGRGALMILTLLVFL
jgi:hypothetical protein